MSDLAVGFTPWPSELAARYRETGYWRGETLGDLLRTWATAYGDAEALVDPVSGNGRHSDHYRSRLTYSQLDRLVDERAAGLRELGIGAGDRMVLQLPNTAEFVVLTFALARIGAVPVMALPAHRRTEIEHLASLSEAVGYVVADSYQGFDHRTLAGEIVELVPGVKHVLVDGDPGPYTALSSVTAPALSESPPVDSASIAVLLISGGTTGKPKLIPRTHDDYAYNARASAALCAFTADDRYLVALPAAHNFPLACPGILGILGVGGTVVMCPAPSPDVALPLIEQERVTVTGLVPPLARLWVEAAPHAGADLSTLRLLQVGGAKLDAALARRIPSALGAQVQQVFGMAEGLLNYTRLDDPAEIVEISQGRPLSPDDEIRVVDSEGVDVAPGEVGELLTRGPYTLRGYYRVPEYNATAFSPEGWYRSGDVVRVLPTGHLVVEGRVKDVINRGGENVSAGELEEHLLGHPAVAAATVVGLPDETLGEIVCAVVVPGPDGPPKLKALKAFLGEQGLARFKHPDKLVIVDELPLTAVGKISKRDVVERLST